MICVAMVDRTENTFNEIHRTGATAMKQLDAHTPSGKFAWLTHPGSVVRPQYDIVVASNEHFVAVPSLGSIVPGWVLLVPRRPMQNLALLNVDERRALDELRKAISKRLESYGCEIFAFEHGGHTDSLVSCGVDQAHLHLVPLPFDLVEAVGRRGLGWTPINGIRSLTSQRTGGKEYLFVEHGQRALIAFPTHATSQWFRQVIAQECGAEEWDYKKIPNLRLLAATARRLKIRTPVTSELTS